MLFIALATLALGTAAMAQSLEPVLYEGQPFDQAGKPVDGTHRLKLRYLDDKRTELLVETLDAVSISAGRFDVELGAGRLHKSSQLDESSPAPGGPLGP